MCTEKQLDTLALFLEQQSPHANDPKHDLQLISQNSDKRSDCLVDSILHMAHGDDCDSGRLITKISKYVKKYGHEDRVSQMLQYAARPYFDRCKLKYDAEIAKAILDMGRNQRAKFIDFLSDKFVDDYREVNKEFVDSLGPIDDTKGFMLGSRRMIHDYMARKLSVPEIKREDKKMVLKGSLIVGKRFAVSCPLFLKKSHKHINELRQVVSIIGGDSLLQMSHNFWNNVFRYNYCESIPKLSTLPGFRKKMKEMMRSYGADKALSGRNRRDLVAGTFIAIMVMAAMFIFLWGLKCFGLRMSENRD